MNSSLFRELMSLLKDVEVQYSDLPAQIWFSAETQSKLYNLYLDLDVDHDGMLSDTEVMRYCKQTCMQFTGVVV